MEQRALGATGLLVSVLGYGAAPIGFAPNPDESAFIRLMQEAHDAGVTFFDTAPDYRDSERLLGEALRERREAVIYATKAGRIQTRNHAGEWEAREDWSAAAVLSHVEHSLRNLQTDYLDIVQLHSPPFWAIENGDALAGLEQAQAQGKVRFIGLSADGDDARYAVSLRRADGNPVFATLQTSYSVLQQGAGEPNGLLDECARQGIGVILKQPVANGIADLLTRPEHPDWSWKWGAAQRMNLTPLGERGERTTNALRWLLADPRFATAIVGTKNPDHFRRNLSAASRPFDPAVFVQLQADFRVAMQ